VTAARASGAPLKIAGWDALVEDLRREVATSVERTVEHMRLMPSYASLDVPALRVVVRRNHEAVLDGLALRRPPEAADVSVIFGEAGEVRARQGVVLSDMLAAWRVGQESLYILASASVPHGPDRDALLREFLELLMNWVDVAMLAAADGHRRAELSRAREREHATANLVRRLMAGAAAPAEIRMAVGAMGVDPDATFHAVRARPDPTADVETIEHYLGTDVPASRGWGLAALVDGDVCGFVARLPNAPAPIAIGISEPTLLPELEIAFRHAQRALDAALALGVKGVFDLATLGVQAAVVKDADVGDAMVARYVESLGAVTGGDAILDTVEHFLTNDRSVDLTARDLGLHNNTIRQRLIRFEEMTGRSLRETETVVEVWWALQRRRIG
jgi:hypothetical protein